MHACVLFLSIVVAVARARVCTVATSAPVNSTHLRAVCAALGCNTDEVTCPLSCFQFVPPSTLQLPLSSWHLVSALPIWSGTCVDIPVPVAVRKRNPDPGDLASPDARTRPRVGTRRGAATMAARGHPISKHVIFEVTVAGGRDSDAFEADAGGAFANASSPLFGCRLSPRRRHGLTRSVTCDAQSIDATWTRRATDALADLQGVLHTEERALAHTTNFWSRNTVTRGDTHPLAYTGPRGLGTGSVLNGRGQVVGAIDTGVDLLSVFFREATGGTPYVGCNSDGHPLSNQRELGPVSFTGRKVVQYVYDASGSGACGDRFDLDGHGSHTSGTNVGTPNCATGADGLPCPLETLEFSGVAPGASLAMFDAGPAADGSLIIPDDPGRVADWTALAGGHVHCNSWGANAGGMYSSFDQSLDSYAFLNPEMLFVVAAGNNGDNTGFGSVTSPGLAKNALTVGAAVSPPAAFELAFCGGSARQPSDAACSAYASADRTQNVAYFSSFGYAHAGRRAKPDVVAPSFYVWSAAHGQPAQVSQSAAFSSAPWSAGLLEGMGGTSMATPAVGGIALLVRQYFTEGWWPCGFPGSGPAWTSVSSSLVKAIIIASSSALTGVMESTDSGGTRLPLPGTGHPSYVQGYGRPNLLSVLRVLGEADFLRTPPLELPAVTRETLPNGVGAERTLAHTGSTFVFVACPWNSSDSRGWIGAATLTATLVWTDLPAFPGIDSHSDLVNNLDLSLWSTATGALLARGNDHVVPSMTGSPLRTDPLSQPDTTSNVEQASISRATAPSSVQIQVTASYLLVPQRFSLVLTGGWGSCSAPGAVLCPANQTNQTSIPQADASSAPTLPVAADVWMQDVLYLYADTLQLLLLGTTQTCSEAGACADASVVEYAELVLASAAPTHRGTRTVRIRTPMPQEALALCGPNTTVPLVYPRGALLLRNWIRLSFSASSGNSSNNGDNAVHPSPLQISLPAIMDGHRGVLDQDLLFCVVGTAQWAPLSALQMTTTDTVDLSVSALRVRGSLEWPSAGVAVDVLVVQRTTLPGHGVASLGTVSTYCDPAWRGCDCQYTGTSSTRSGSGQTGNWAVAAVASAMAALGLCALAFDRATAPLSAPGKRARAHASGKVPTQQDAPRIDWLATALSCFTVSVSFILFLSASRAWERAITLATAGSALLFFFLSSARAACATRPRDAQQTADNATAASAASWATVATVYLCMISAYGPSAVLDNEDAPGPTYARTNAASSAPYAALLVLVVAVILTGSVRAADASQAALASRIIAPLLHTAWVLCFVGIALQRSTGVQLVALPIALFFSATHTSALPLSNGAVVHALQITWTFMFPYVYNRLPCE